MVMELLFDKIVGGPKVRAQFTTLCNLAKGARDHDFKSGLRHLQFLYAKYWAGPDGRIDFDLVERQLPGVGESLLTDMLCLDVEGDEWKGLGVGNTDPAIRQRASDDVKRLCDVTRRLLPGVNLGLFGFPCISPWYFAGRYANRSEGNKGKFWRYWQTQLELLEFHRDLADHLDFYSPSFTYWINDHWYFPHNRSLEQYWRDDQGRLSPLFQRQSSSSLQSWITTAIDALRCVRDMLPARPRIPCVSAQWFTEWGGKVESFDCPKNETLVDPAWVLESLGAIRQDCDSVVMFLTRKTIGGFQPPHYFASKGWQSVVEWAEKHKEK